MLRIRIVEVNEGHSVMTLLSRSWVKIIIKVKPDFFRTKNPYFWPKSVKIEKFNVRIWRFQPCFCSQNYVFYVTLPIVKSTESKTSRHPATEGKVFWNLATKGKVSQTRPLKARCLKPDHWRQGVSHPATEGKASYNSAWDYKRCSKCSPLTVC